MNKKILVIDSGIGGITTLHEIKKLVPNADIIYFADDLFLPYGDKDAQKLFVHLASVIERFEEQICGVVLACNTATGVAIEKLRNLFCFPFVGTEPAIVPACKNNNRAMVLVTPLEAVQHKFARLAQNRDAFVLPMPNLAKAIDDALQGGCVQVLEKSAQVVQQVEIAKEVAKVQNLDKIVLGCTHYVFLKYTRLLKDFELFDGNLGVAKRVAFLFENEGSGKVEFVFGSKDKKKSQIALRLFEQLSNL